MKKRIAELIASVFLASGAITTKCATQRAVYSGSWRQTYTFSHNTKPVFTGTTPFSI